MLFITYLGQCMHPKAQSLLDAQLHFIQNQLHSETIISEEVLGFFAWFKQQKIGHIWSSELINALLQQQILLTPLTTHLITQIQQHIELILAHPQNNDTTIEDILPVETIDQIAQYIASKTEHRQQLIHQIVHNPAYTELIMRIVQQSVKDYMDNSMVARKVPGVGSLMKMGKAALEKATDSNLDDTLKHYLQKNIHTLSHLSEKLINQYFDDHKLYHLQADLWHKIKKAPISSLQHYIIHQDLPETIAMGEQIWNHLRQTPYLQAQIATNVEAWLQRNANKSFATLLTDINIDENLLRTELYQLIMPIITMLIEDGYLLERVRYYLNLFYCSKEVEQILTN